MFFRVWAFAGVAAVEFVGIWLIYEAINSKQNFQEPDCWESSMV
nr:YfjD family protein [Bacillus paralicheniformis]